MNIHELDTETMQKLERLADINVQISKAKTILSQLSEEEASFLEDREKKAVEKVNSILEHSQSIVDQINHNHDQVTQFHNTVVSFVGFLEEIYDKTKGLMESFDTQSEQWEAKVIEQDESLSTRKALLDKQTNALAEEKENLKKKEKDLIAFDRALNDKYATLERTQARIKSK